MTQNYDHDAHEQDGDAEHGAIHDQAEIHEAPSDDEFADEGSLAAATEDKAKGRSPLLPLAAAGAVIVLLGGVAWWQFAGSSSPSTSAAPLGTQPIMAMASPAPALSQPVAAKVAAASLGPSPDSTSAAAVPASTVPANPSPMASAVNDIPKLTSDHEAPNFPTPSNMAGAGSTPAPGLNTNAGNPAPSAMTGGETQRIDALADRIDDMQKTLGHVTEQLSQVSTMMAAAAPASSDTKAMQDRLSKLEQQMAQNHATAPALAAPAVLAGDEAIAPVPAVKPAMPVIHHKAASAHHAAKGVVKTARRAVEVKAAPKAVSSHWVLRAAMPDQAWIATSTTDKDLKPVHVGDTLAGVGRVTAIEAKDDGTWVVQGTKSAIQ